MKPAGYIVQQHTERLSRTVKAYKKWAERIPSVYREEVLGEQGPVPLDAGVDPNCLARLKHYRSLIPMAQEARKPIFHLTAADGAIGNHASAASDSRKHFKELADVILAQILI